MKNMFYTFLAMCCAFSVNAQLTNNGATIIVEDGAKLFIETDLNNNVAGSTGTITVLGTGIIEVQGNLTNAGTVSMSDGSKLIFSGTGGSDVTSGGATFSNVELDKAAEDVTLLDEMRISKDLNFVGDDNKVILGNNNLVFAPQATITSADDNEYIVADGDVGTGVVSKELDADEVFTYHVGDATNYTPLAADLTGTAYSSATVGVNTVGMKQSNVPAEADDFINRYWNVDQSGVTDFSADLTGTYVAADLESGSTAADVKGAHYGTEWSYDGAAAGMNTVLGTVAESGDFTGTNSFGKVGLKIFLQGAYSGGTMNTNLNSILPLTSPYDPTVTVASIPANVTDWINLEILDDTTPSIVVSSHSAFLRNDGVVLDLQGNVNPLLLDAPTTGYVAIKHQNHLTINTSIALNLTSGGFDTHDFSSMLSQAYDNPAITSNDAMIDLGSGVFGMLRGDINSSNNINVIDAALTKNNSFPIFSGYSKYDINFNGTVNVIDAALVKAASFPIKSAHVQ